MVISKQVSDKTLLICIFNEKSFFFFWEMKHLAQTDTGNEVSLFSAPTVLLGLIYVILSAVFFYFYFFASFAIIKGLFPLHNDFQMTRLSLFSLFLFLRCIFFIITLFTKAARMFIFISFRASKVSVMSSGPLERQIANAN